MPRYQETYDAQLAVLCYSKTKKQLEALARVKMINVSQIVRRVLSATIPSLIGQLNEQEKRAFDTIMETDDIAEELEELIRRDADEPRTESANGSGDSDSTPSVTAEPPSQF